MRYVLTALAVWLCCSNSLPAQDAAPGAAPAAKPAAETKVDPSAAAIQAAIDNYVTAFNAGDAKKLAALWTEQGELVTPGGAVWKGRAQLEEQFAAYFAETKGAKIELTATQVVLHSPSVAVETGVARVLLPDEEPSESEYKAIHVKTAEGWRMDSVTEGDIVPPPPSNYDQLQELAWMVGSWVDTDDNADIVTTCRWTANQNFLVQTFKVYIEDRIDFEGTQIIGWDPRNEAIRSWMFDSDGGFGVGRWSGGDGKWTVQSLHTLPDGRQGSSTNVYELVDDNAVKYSSIGRQVDGELMPNIAPVNIVRAE
jgi:uncharacterized protein (TIGR02246 family)